MLTIGEVAGLVGVTPKVMRHYHGVGLLREPERSEAGYRLYGAEDLLRLGRVRRLAGLGLSLKQVGEVLGEPGGERPLREVLGELLGEVEKEIGHLQGRREAIKALLAGEDPEAPPPSPTFEMLKRRLGEHLPDGVSPALWEREERLWATLDAYRWPEGYREMWEAFARHYAERPDEYRKMVALGERLEALADAPADVPKVEELAGELARFHADPPGPSRDVGAGAGGVDARPARGRHGGPFWRRSSRRRRSAA